MIEVQSRPLQFRTIVRRLVIWLGTPLLLSACIVVAVQFARSITVETDPASARRVSSSPDSFPAGVGRLDSIVEPIRAATRVPSLALAIVHGDSVVALGVVGVRRAGAAQPVRWYDRFHIGSDTKAMTATLIAMLVDDGRLRWTTTLGELFPELSATMRPEYRHVTVDMLLHHCSGLPDDRSDGVMFARLRKLRGTAHEQRMRAVALFLSRPPACAPGTRSIYANANFDILGAVAEELTGETWESLVERHLFAPLGMRRAGFGSPNTPGRLDAPWGHRISGRWPPRVFWITSTMLPVAGAPAGNVSLSMLDWAQFASLHLPDPRGTSRLLPRTSIDHLHAEMLEGSGYAAGWGVSHGSLGDVLQHSGSDGWWFATIEIDEAPRIAILTATNMGGPRGAEACTRAIGAARSWLRSRHVAGAK